MAIAVPFLMSATGAAAAIGGALGVSATLVSTVTSVIFQVSGVNDKINKAAAKVFGEDLVKVANIGGAAFAAFNGGFDLGGGATDASSVGAVNGMDAASDAYTAAGGTASDGLSAIGDASGGLASGSLLDKAALDGTNAFGANSQSVNYNLAEMAAPGATVVPTETQGADLIGGKLPGTDTSPRADSPALEAASKPVQTTGAAGQAAAAPSAAGTNAAGQSAAGSDASAPNSTAANAASAPKNVFERLLLDSKGNVNDKVVGSVIQGLGQGLMSADKNKLTKEQLEWQRQRYSATPNFRIAQ